jgi:hypothetical protein
MPEAAHAKSLPFRRGEVLRAAAYIAILLWINLYIARDFFSGHTAYMNSMHGFWIALAKRGSGALLHPSWWPYWDCGIPFEAAYAPLVPWLTAAWAAIFRTPFDMAFSSVTGMVYCLAPISLFLMAWGLTRAAGTSFLAALFYSLASPTQWIVPDGEFRWDRIWEARRLFLVSAWDDTPHLTALALLPLAMLFLALSIERRRRIYYACAALCIALMATASAFGPVMVAMSAAGLLAASPVKQWKRRALLIVGIGAYAYLMAIAFVPPSVLQAIRESTTVSDEEKWSLGSITGIAIALLGFSILRYLLRRQGGTPVWRSSPISPGSREAFPWQRRICIGVLCRSRLAISSNWNSLLRWCLLLPAEQSCGAFPPRYGGLLSSSYWLSPSSR